MNKRKKFARNRKAAQKQNIVAMVVVGAGLILIGAAALFALPSGTNAGQEQSGISRTVPVEVDFAAPELKLSDLNGDEHALADYRGQVVLVNLWATWCPPCKAEMPTLQSFYEDHQADGFVTIAVNDGDPAEAVTDFAQQYGLTFPVWLDPKYEATERAFKTLNLPSSFVIDRTGKVRLRWVGEIDRATLEKYVTPLIAE